MRYQVEHKGKFSTINAMSPVGAVAAISHAPLHSWQAGENGWLEVQARRGNGEVIGNYSVKEC